MGEKARGFFVDAPHDAVVHCLCFLSAPDLLSVMYCGKELQLTAASNGLWWPHFHRQLQIQLEKMEHGASLHDEKKTRAGLVSGAKDYMSILCESPSFYAEAPNEPWLRQYVHFKMILLDVSVYTVMIDPINNTAMVIQRMRDGIKQYLQASLQGDDDPSEFMIEDDETEIKAEEDSDASGFGIAGFRGHGLGTIGRFRDHARQVLRLVRSGRPICFHAIEASRTAAPLVCEEALEEHKKHIVKDAAPLSQWLCRRRISSVALFPANGNVEEINSHYVFMETGKRKVQSLPFFAFPTVSTADAKEKKAEEIEAKAADGSPLEKRDFDEYQVFLKKLDERENRCEFDKRVGFATMLGTVPIPTICRKCKWLQGPMTRRSKQIKCSMCSFQLSICIGCLAAGVVTVPKCFTCTIVSAHYPTAVSAAAISPTLVASSWTKINPAVHTQSVDEVKEAHRLAEQRIRDSQATVLKA